MIQKRETRDFDKKEFAAWFNNIEEYGKTRFVSKLNPKHFHQYYTDGYEVEEALEDYLLK